MDFSIEEVLVSLGAGDLVPLLVESVYEKVNGEEQDEREGEEAPPHGGWPRTKNPDTLFSIQYCRFHAQVRDNRPQFEYYEDQEKTSSIQNELVNPLRRF